MLHGYFKSIFREIVQMSEQPNKVIYSMIKVSKHYEKSLY